MSSSIPTTTKAYTIDITKGGFDGLLLDTSVPISPLKPHECLVAIHAVSLNYRDIAMPLGLYPAATKDKMVPCSDGAGTVLAVGSDVKSISVGDKVCPTFFQNFDDGFLTKEARVSSLGGLNDGVLRKHGIFGERGLVKLPDHLHSRDASTLPCAALTAWNALFGVEGRKLKKGDWVLAQGTGGVSIFAMLFAKALGAHVVATTGDKRKEGKLKDMGVDAVINYREDENWGSTALGIIEKAGGTGAQHILEVGGENTIQQSFKAVACEGIISIIGFLSGTYGAATKPGVWDCSTTVCLVRVVKVGSKKQFEDMLAFIKEKDIKPVVDERVWKFSQAKQAFEYMKAQTFFGKVVIDFEL